MASRSRAPVVVDAIAEEEGEVEEEEEEAEDTTGVAASPCALPSGSQSKWPVDAGERPVLHPPYKGVCVDPADALGGNGAVQPPCTSTNIVIIFSVAKYVH